VEAFVVLIVLPLALAWLTQAWAARTSAGRRFSARAGALMVPLMALTLLVVVASQVPALDHDAAAVLGVLPFYVAFLVVMAPLGVGVARAFRLDTGAARAIVFTGATRNSLVVLPLALALPDGLAAAAVVIVGQTLVEVVGMVVYVRVVPRLLPGM
ncbi:MAG: arsenic resistance protein, partial [Actinomycetes bacterium]